MARDPKGFDPNDRSTWPGGYPDALDVALGDSPIRYVFRIDHRGVSVRDVWDMRPARLGGSPRCVAISVETDDEAAKVAEEILANRVSVDFGGRKWTRRPVRRLVEGSDGER